MSPSNCQIKGAETMSYEFDPAEISGIQLRESKTQPKVSLSREIGVAEITHTIFGRAKVRIIRKHDKIRRSLMLTALVVTALLAAAWQGWIVLQQSEPQVSADPATTLSSSDQASVSAPDLQAENITSQDIPPSAKNEPGIVPQTEINSPASNLESAQQTNSGLKDDESVAPKPAKSHSRKTHKTQPESLASNDDALMNQTDMQPSAKLPLLKKPVAPAVVTLPAAKPSTPTATSADIPVLSAPLAKEYTSNPSPAGNNLPAGSSNAQSK
jgi:hypothetical protein